MQRALPGAALIALRTDATVLPVGITGTEQISLGILLKRPRITVTIGEPFRLEHSGKINGAVVRTATETMMRRIAELLPEEYQGVWSASAIKDQELEAIRGQESETGTDIEVR
jgi:1-acyl-sn-glycerol-3-phosphate acyltransferase